MPEDLSSSISCRIAQSALVCDDAIDISFLARQHRRRLSKTVQLALTAFHRCNPELDSLQTVFASRYGEFTRTFGILQDIVAAQPSSPAAFSVSVHNTPGGITGIATGNKATSSTVAANAATIEAGFLEAAMQHQERAAEQSAADDIIFVFVDEPLPDLYSAFRNSNDQSYAFGLRLSNRGKSGLKLSWHQQADGPRRGPDGIPAAGMAIARFLEAGSGSHSTHDGRLAWKWTIDQG